MSKFLFFAFFYVKSHQNVFKISPENRVYPPLLAKIQDFNPEKGSKSENFARGRCKNVYFLLIFSDFEEKSSARLMYMLSALNSKIQSISSKDHQKIIKISSKYQCILLAESATKALAKMPNFEGHSMRAPYNGFFWTW